MKIECLRPVCAKQIHTHCDTLSSCRSPKDINAMAHFYILIHARDLFYMECVREPPEWFLWVWTLHSGPDIEQFVVNIRLFKVGQEREMGAEER